MNKQEIQEQIETIKEKLDKLEKELAENEKIELKQGKYYLNGTGQVSDWTTPIEESAGATRATKELAEIASQNMVTRNKLEAYAHQIDQEWRDGGFGTRMYAVALDNRGKYTIGAYINYRPLGVVLMSKSTAEQICEWLNDGRIEL